MEKLREIQQALDDIDSREDGRFVADRETILGRYGDGSGEPGLAIKVLSVFGGLLATLAFAAFLGFLDIFDHTATMLGLGIGLWVLSLGIQRLSNALVLDSLGVSLHLLGLCLVIPALEQYNLPGNGIALGLILLALGNLLLSKNYVLNFISVLIVACALLYLVLENDMPNLIHGLVIFQTLALALVMLGEAKFLAARPYGPRLFGPLRIGLALSLLIPLALIGATGLAPEGTGHLWISALPALAIILGMLPAISRTLGSAGKGRTLIYILVSLALLPLLFAPAIAGSLLLVLLSIKTAYRTGLAIGIIALAYFVIQFYYDLNMGLLPKSLLLFATGLLFLACHFLFTKRNSPHEED